MLAFSDPVHQSQTVFREVLEAMAHPGRIVELSVAPALEAVALTLFDADVEVWAPPGEPRRAWLRERCGCRLTDHPAAAAFAVISEASELPPLDAFASGTPVEPERSTTIVLAVRALRGGTRTRLRGPGISGEVAVAPQVPASFWEAWTRNASRSPLGVDVILASDTAVLALPRSAQVAG